MSKELESMAILNGVCGSVNIPGITKVEYVPVQWVETWPEFIDDNNTITIPIVLIPGKDWLLASFSAKSAVYNENQSSKKHSDSYKVSLDAIFATDNAGASELFDEMAKYQYILKITDRNGLVRVVGNPKTLLSFTSNLTTGKQPGDTKGYKYSFEGLLFHRSPFYSV